MTEDIAPISPPLSELLQRKVETLEEAIRTHRAACYAAVDEHSDIEDMLEADERASEILWRVLGDDLNVDEMLWSAWSRQ